MSTSDEGGSFLGNLADCQLDLAYYAMFNVDTIYCLLQQGVFAAFPDDKTDSRPHCGLAVYQIDISAVVRCYNPDQTAAGDLSNDAFYMIAGAHQDRKSHV